MASCGYCGTTILFGGKRDGNNRFCNEKCLHQGQLVSLSNTIPPDVVLRHTHEVHQGNCPKCDGPGPVDVHVSHRVWSALIMTNWSSHPAVSCSGCATKRKLGDSVFCLFLGWWGFPWGILMTPVQIGRNLFGLASKPAPGQPSPALEKMVRLDMAQRIGRP